MGVLQEEQQAATTASDAEVVDSTTTTSVKSVRELAKRFERLNGELSSGRGAAEVQKRREIGGLSTNRATPPVLVGIVRKKSSSKFRSKSYFNIYTGNCNRVKRSPSKKSLPLSNSCPGGFTNLPETVKSPPSPPRVPPRQKPVPPVKPRRSFRASSEIPTTESTESQPMRDPQPTYRETATASLTVPAVGCPVARPRSKAPSPPAPPSAPPSRNRINRIPSYLNATVRESKSPQNRRSAEEVFSSPTPPKSQKDYYEIRTTKNFVIPQVPSFSPPPLPKDSPPGPGVYEDDQECYEEIGYGSPERKVPQIPDVKIRPLPIPCEPSTSNDGEFVTNIYCSGFESKCTRRPSCKCAVCVSQRRRSHYHLVDDVAASAEDVRGSYDVMSRSEANSNGTSTAPRQFQSATLNRRSSKMPRPTSALDMEKLFRFKSELQLNLSKKMVQLRQKVERRPRSSKCRVDAAGLQTDVHDRNPDDDRYIYGDDWSSDEDEDAFDDRRSSMYKELEAHLNSTFPIKMKTEETDYECADEVSTPDSSTASSSAAADRPDCLALRRPSLADLNLDDPSPDYDFSKQYTSRLPTDQPLYQIYMMEENGKLLEDCVGTSAGIHEEVAKTVEEDVAKERKAKSRRESSASSDSGRGADCSTSTSALTSNTSMRRERLIASSHFGSQRSLWCELPEVISAGLLDTLDEDTKLRQEAYFEVITSEASYLRSLNILITHFMASQEFLGSKSALSIITNADRKQLFSNIFAVRDCSERLLCDLESRLEENLVLDDLSDILALHFEKNFDVYVKYCSNQVYQDRTLRRLKSENSGFLTAVSRLESDRQCQGLDMRSFLMLPMQRVTRYPLLMYAIIDRLTPDSEKYKTATEALAAANKVVRECNEGARRMERTEQLLEVDRRLVYKDADLKRIPLVSNSRYLVKRGALVQIVERRSKGLLQSRQKARCLHVFLFSDIIMITKKKLNGTYICKDYAARRFIDVEPVEPESSKVPPGAVASIAGRPHLFHCVLMRNARGRQTELLLNADSETDRERWLSAIRPPTSLNPEEKVYAEWDCPQAVAVHTYTKNQVDELDLVQGDSVNILRKMPDGWFYGERTRDGASGWFPSSYVQQILNDHVRANNYRQRLRLIQAASNGTSIAANLAAPRGSISRGTNAFMDRLKRASRPRIFFPQNTVGT